MKVNWTAGLDEVRRNDIRQSFKASLVMRKRLLELLEKKMKESWASSIAEDSYESPNWALKQADARGYERAMKEIMSLVK